MDLIVNADDLGYCQERDDGIIELIKTGIVRNASLIVNGSSVNYAIEKVKQLIKNNYQCTIGLHLNLTEGRPISENVLTLVDENYEMLGKFGFRSALEENRISMEELKLESLAQIKFFKSHIKDHLHFDSHQHIHVLPAISELIAQIFHNEGFTTVRIPSYHLNVNNLTPFLQTVVSQTEQVKGQYLKYFKSSDYFIGLDLMGTPNLSVLRNNLESLITSNQLPRSIEWMCHPGYRSLEYGDDFSRSEQRENELKFLLSQDLAEFLKELQIEISGWPKLIENQ